MPYFHLYVKGFYFVLYQEGIAGKMFVGTAIPYNEVQGFTGKYCNENRISAMRAGFAVMNICFSL